MISVTPLALPEVKLLRLTRHADDRGSFMETFSSPAFEAARLPAAWAQDNEVHSVCAGVVRGLHFQAPPYAQAKLVRVVSGRILDVAVDVRSASPTYGCHVAIALHADRAEAVLIPEGFAHGYCTLCHDCLVQYKVSRPYAPAAERALLWCDPALAIAWPVSRDRAVVSAKDAAATPLSDLRSPF